jgi:tRNA pseudouridine55 synthase
MNILISLYKPKGISSQGAVSELKKILKVKKAGHTGTLDPMGTGLLLICTNKATRLASYFSNLDKEYSAVMKLGEVTDTQDAEGKVTEKTDRIEVDNVLILDTLKSFEGKILQQPPMFSALKHKGKSLYEFARKGIEIERESREIKIHNIELLNIDLPYVSFKTLCSKGTYIRTLCHDIGRKLGVGAHLLELERTAIGQFKIEDSLTFGELKSVSGGEQIHKGIYTMDEALAWLPQFKVKEFLLKAVIHGNPIKLNDKISLSDDLKQALLAIGSYSNVKNVIQMDVVFA